MFLEICVPENTMTCSHYFYFRSASFTVTQWTSSESAELSKWSTRYFCNNTRYLWHKMFTTTYAIETNLAVYNPKSISVTNDEFYGTSRHMLRITEASSTTKAKCTSRKKRELCWDNRQKCDQKILSRSWFQRWPVKTKRLLVTHRIRSIRELSKKVGE